MHRSAIHRTLSLAVVVAGARATACHAPSRGSAATRDSSSCAECPVCKCEGDLACLTVEIREDTPRAVVDGQTYYFCSEECCADFQERPAQYCAR